MATGMAARMATGMAEDGHRMAAGWGGMPLDGSGWLRMATVIGCRDGTRDGCRDGHRMAAGMAQ
eukprot:gene12075-2669_t